MIPHGLRIGPSKDGGSTFDHNPAFSHFVVYDKGRVRVRAQVPDLLRIRPSRDVECPVEEDVGDRNHMRPPVPAESRDATDVLGFDYRFPSVIKIQRA